MREASPSSSNEYSRLRAVYEQSPIAIELCDAEGRLIEQNPACVELFGAFNPAGIDRFCLFDDPNLTAEVIAALRRGEKVHYQSLFDFDRVRGLGLYDASRSGSVWLDVIISSLKDEQGQISGYMVQSQDITAYIAMEEQLRRKGQHYALLMQASHDPIHVLDRNGNLVEWNCAFLKHLGYTAEEVSGLHVTDWNVQWQAGKLPYSFEELIAAPRTFETLHRRKDGTFVAVEVSTVSFTGEGDVFLYISTRDISERKLAETRLRESEERYRRLFENMQQGFALHEVILDAQGVPYDMRYLEVNQTYEQQMGLKRTELIGRTMREVMPGAGRSQAEFYSRAALDGEPVTFEFYSRALSRYFRVRAFCPQPGQMATILEDITRMRETETALRDSEQKYRIIFENGIYAIVIFDQRTLRIIDANDTFLQMYGYEREDLENGITVYDLNSEDREASLASIKRTITEGTNYVPLRHHRKKNGAPFSVEIVSGPHVWRGRPVVFSMMRDISLREKIQAELRASEARFRALFNQAHDAVFLLDLQGRHIMANQRAAEMLGYTTSEIQGISFRETSAELDDSLHIIERLLAGEAVPLYRRLFRKKNGEIFPVEINVELVRDDQGQPLHIQSVVRDISHRS